MKRTLLISAFLALPFFAQNASAALIVTTSADATALANFLVSGSPVVGTGNGITIVGTPTLIGVATQQGTFTGGTDSGVGLSIATGVILTNGNASLAPGPNNADNPNATTTNTGANALLSSLTSNNVTLDQNVLSFNFTTTTGNLFFKYQFASEEYNESVGTGFNDLFAAFVDGVKMDFGAIAFPSIDNVNCGNNGTTSTSTCSLFNNNDLSNGGPFFNIQYDGFTTLLPAQRLGLSPGTHTLTLAIADAGAGTPDQITILDSAVFFGAGSFSAGPTAPPPTIPEPASLALLGIGLAGLGAMRRRKTA